MGDLDSQSGVFYELCSMIVHLLRIPPLPLPFPTLTNVGLSSSKTTSPAAFGSLFLGISVALMLFGSLTFFIGFILMPLVIGLVLLFYFAGFVSILSEFGRSILCPDPLKNGPGKSLLPELPFWGYNFDSIVKVFCLFCLKLFCVILYVSWFRRHHVYFFFWVLIWAAWNYEAEAYD